MKLKLRKETISEKLNKCQINFCMFLKIGRNSLLLKYEPSHRLKPSMTHRDPLAPTMMSNTKLSAWSEDGAMIKWAWWWWWWWWCDKSWWWWWWWWWSWWWWWWFNPPFSELELGNKLWSHCRSSYIFLIMISVFQLTMMWLIKTTDVKKSVNELIWAHIWVPGPNHLTLFCTLSTISLIYVGDWCQEVS